MTTLTIAHHWDGRPLPPEEHAQITLRPDGSGFRMKVDAPFHGNPPPPGYPGPTPKLWEHEVVELFVVGPEGRYTEIELGPYGHHLVLQLEGIRNIVASGLPLNYGAGYAGDRWSGEAYVPNAYLPPTPLICNAFRVGGAGPTRFWHAMAPVPGDRPDFHRLEHFVPWPLAAAP